MKRRLFVATPLLLTGALSCDQWRLLTGAPGSRGPCVARVAGTAFGTVISLCALGAESGQLHNALRRAMREVQRIDALMSLYRPDSQLSVLNRTGALDGADPHLLKNLRFAAELSELTDGAFDVTVQPLWELFDQARKIHGDGALPGADAIARARQLVDYRAVRVEDDRIRLERPGTKITLNSLAQGYAVDVVLQILRREAVQAALVDTGEIGNLGRRAPTEPWTLGVQHPRNRTGLSALIAMDGRVVSTSGDYATTFTSDYRYHHIFDPATGVSPVGYASTIVLASTGLLADGLSTALMVMDRSDGDALLRHYPGSDALWIDKQARLDATAGVPLVQA